MGAIALLCFDRPSVRPALTTHNTHHPIPSTHTGRDAGAAFERAAEAHVKLGAAHEAAASCVEAAKCYQKTDKGDALRAMHAAVAHYTELGRLGMAARQLRDVADTLEKGGDAAAACEFYEQAADLFAGEEQHSEATRCRLKVAALSAEAGRYNVAATLFEDAARAAVDSPLLKFGAKGHLLNAGVCLLAGGGAGPDLDTALDRYESVDPTLAGSREGDLLRALATAASTRDVDAFTSALAGFDAVTRLDAWKTALLLRAKRGLEGGGAGGGDGGEEDLT